MIITNSTLDGLRTTFSAVFAQVFKQTPTWYDQISTSVPSSAKSNTYGWLMNQIALREWIGPRVSLNLSEHEYAIANKLWEATVELRRTDVEDDSLGVFASFTMPNMAASTKKHPDIRLAAVIQANGTAFDAKAFFATDHPTFNATGSGATTYANSFTATDLTADGVDTVRSAMSAYIGENGYPLGVLGDTLIVPPQLERKAVTVAQSRTYAIPTGTVFAPTNVAATVDNVLKGQFKVIVVPELANAATTWYMADTSKPIRPFVYQPRIAPELVARFDPSDPKVFDLDTYVWGVRARYELGFTLPYLCSKVVTT